MRIRERERDSMIQLLVFLGTFPLFEKMAHQLFKKDILTFMKQY